MVSDIAAVGLYFTGIVVGVMLTLTLQVYAASVKRKAWDILACAWDSNYE